MPEILSSTRSRPLTPSALAGSAATPVLIIAVIVGALYFGREILVPIALAVLLSFVLAPLVRLLQRLDVPRSLAVIVVVALAFAAILSLGAFMVSQLNHSQATYRHTKTRCGRKFSICAERP